MTHSHGSFTHRRQLLAVLAITLGVLVVQLVGAALSGSLALAADAVHMLADATGIALAVGAAYLARRPASTRRTFGYYRAEVLAAVLNCLLLLALAGFLLWQAWSRLSEPVPVAGSLMLWFALVGLAANLVSLWILRPASSRNLNVKGAYLEVASDAAGSVAVLLAAAVIAVTSWYQVDALASILIAVMIVWRATLLLFQGVHVLLEGTPTGVDLALVRASIEDIPGVVGVHDLHAWTITSGLPVLAVHVVVENQVLDSGKSGAVLDQVTFLLAEKFELAHSTVQLEAPGHADHEHAACE